MSDDKLRDPSTLTFEQPCIRRRILTSYLVLMFLGLPLWWSTTSIQRLSLPGTRIDFLSGKELRLPISIAVDAVQSSGVLCISFSRCQSVVSCLLNALQNERRSRQSAPPDAYIISLTENAQIPTIQNKHLSIPMQQGQIANRTPELIMSLLTPYETPSPPGTFRHLVVKYAPRYRLAFTLLNGDATAGRAVIGWDVVKMISRWIAPILEQTSELYNFTIESQIQFYAPLAFEPQVLSNGEEVIHGLTQENLKVFINSAEWTLASSVSNDPVLHFVLFIPSISHSPLHILDSTQQPTFSNAFVLPQWGGIVLLNMPIDAPPKFHLTEAELDQVFSGFQVQLLRLIGVPELPLGVQSANSDRPLTDFQLDTLYRQRAFENAGSSKETLQSIIKLVDQISNMPVGQDVRDDVRESLSALEVLYAGVWKAPALALQHSSRALTLASRAFFNPGMLALLYFPAEHKYAVYTPLFAPVAVPLVVTLLKEVSAWRRAIRERKGRTAL
ncbi:phosphatidylinositol-glycan biosynthesis class S protein-domain-containing protein [Multifurca ochricompacta]|uniref:Phosphatidylinositol-glycan biosynthesis class S protein-domain-containing protein n=1 Tax=Multifurca ochricompacta TaxID=376703 RepID=A0AAD4M1U9_9AGAM|nr:phosphatidylinositol-glycan biosynthesis class S protein-domain-containing protein [Multifurca ochricompacta]